MARGGGGGGGSGHWDLEQFVGALTQQLDRIQDTLRVKAVNRPLTFSVRDLDLDLKVLPDYDGERGVVFRTAAPGETNASSLKLQLATITRPLIDQSTRALDTEEDPRPIRDVGGIPKEARTRLERMGVSTVGDLRRLGQSPTAVSEIAHRADVTVEDLARVIHETRRPRIRSVGPGEPGGPPRLKLRGDNLSDLARATVRVGDQPARVTWAGAEEAEVELLRRPTSTALEIDVAGQPPIRLTLPSRRGP